MSQLLSDGDVEALAEDALGMAADDALRLMGAVGVGEVVRVMNNQILEWQHKLQEAIEEEGKGSRVARDCAASIVALREVRDAFKDAATGQAEVPQ